MTIVSNKQSTTRILIHSQDDAGLDGAECTLAMTNHWSRLYANASFLILTDLSRFNRLDLPPHVDYIHTPQGGTLQQTVLLTTLAHFDPHMLIVHYSPTAVIQDSHKTAVYARQHHPNIKIILGLWNPVQRNEFNPNDWLNPSLYQRLQALYDQIWFYTPDPLLENSPKNGTQTLLTRMRHNKINGNGQHH